LKRWAPEIPVEWFSVFSGHVKISRFVVRGPPFQDAKVQPENASFSKVPVCRFDERPNTVSKNYERKKVELIF
jgi:hypothetical protein